MTINRKKRAAVIFVIAICGASVSRAMGQQTLSRTDPLRIVKYDGDMASMLRHLSNTYDVTIGFEVDAQQPKPQVGFYVRDATLADVLNAVVEAAPRYHWRESEGFIEVLPRRGSSRLLDTIITNFRVNDVDAAAAISQLVNLPEVQAGIRAMSLNPRDPGNASTEGEPRKFSLSLEGVTVRQALNRLAKENGARFWIFERYGNTFSIGNAPWYPVRVK